MTFELSYEMCIFKIMSKALALLVTSADLKKMPDVLIIKFYLSKMRTAAQEKALHTVLRNCSKETGGSVGGWGTVSVYDFGEGRVHAIKHIFFQAFLLIY